MKKYLGIAFMVVCAAVLSSQPSWREQVGRQPDGSFVVSSGWRVQPAGKQVPLDTLPMSMALSKDGKFLMVLNGGYRPPSIIVLSAADMHEVSRVPLKDAWLGLAVSPDGKHVYAGGGSRATVFEFTIDSDGKLTAGRELVVVPEDKRERFGELMADCLRRQQPDASADMLQRERDKALRAPVIVVVAAQINRTHKIPAVEQLVSAAAAAENIMLAANAQGFGAMWKTGAPAYDAQVKQALGLDPDNDIVGFMYIGTQVGGGSPAARPVVQDLVSVWQG